MVCSITVEDEQLCRQKDTEFRTAKIIGLEEDCEQIARRHEGCKFEMRTQYTEIDGRRLYAGKTEQMEAEDRKV